MLSFKKSASSRSMLQYLVFETCIKTRSTAVKGFSLEPSYDVCIFSEENLLNIGALLLSVDLTTVRIYMERRNSLCRYKFFRYRYKRSVISKRSLPPMSIALRAYMSSPSVAKGRHDLCCLDQENQWKKNE